MPIVLGSRIATRSGLTVRMGNSSRNLKGTFLDDSTCHVHVIMLLYLDCYRHGISITNSNLLSRLPHPLSEFQTHHRARLPPPPPRRLSHIPPRAPPRHVFTHGRSLCVAQHRNRDVHLADTVALVGSISIPVTMATCAQATWRPLRRTHLLNNAPNNIGKYSSSAPASRTILNHSPLKLGMAMPRTAHSSSLPIHGSFHAIIMVPPPL